MRNLYLLLKRSLTEFFNQNCYLNALALSYYTLLSIVPLLAVAFGIAKGFGFEELLEKLVRENFYQNPEFADKVIQFANSMLEHTHGSVIAGFGVLALFWSINGLLSSFEKIVNQIWHVPESREWSRKIPDFLALIILFPIFVIMTSSFTVFIIQHLVSIANETGTLDTFKNVIYFIYYFLLLALSWILFTFIYLFIPNRRVPRLAAMIAGILAGTSFQILQWTYVHLQVFLSSYNAIYGSFAAIPLFLLWLEFSWLITLAGVEISYQIANLSENK